MQLDDALIDDIATIATIRVLAAGDLLVRAGDTDDQVHVVSAGELTVHVSDAQSAVLGRLGRGALVGEISAIAGGPRTATVRADTDVEVFTLEVGAFARWLDLHESVAVAIVGEARRRFDQLHAVEMLAALAGEGDAETATALGTILEIVRVDAGETLYAKGTVADDAYLVVSGRIGLDDGSGTRRLVGRRSFLGVDALFEEAPRPATATALRETTLGRIRRESLERLATDHPRVLLLAARAAVYESRLAVVSNRPVNIAVAVTAPGDPQELMGPIHDEVSRHGRVISLSSASVDQTLGREGIAQAAIDSVGLPRLNEFLHELELAHDHVLRLADTELTGWTRRTLLHADRVLVVCSPDPDDDEVRRLSAISELVRSVGHQPLWLGVLHPAGTERPRHTAALMDRFGAAKALHARRGDAAALARWARLASGHGVGLVLSGGGARGFAHLGAYRALAEAGLPVDTVGGASIGGPVGVAICMSGSPSEATALVRRQFHRLLDYTLPVTSLLKGKRIAASIASTLDGRDIEDLWVPFYCTSTNLTRSQVEVHRRGDATTAVRATVAIPGVLPPVPYHGDLLIDGGVLDNLPARQMRDDGSIGTVIAVDVAPPLGPRASVDYGHSMSGWRALFGRLRGKPPSPPIAAVLLRTMLVAAVLDRNTLLDEGLIDLHLDLELKGVGLLEFERVDEIADLGYGLARARVAAWREQAPAPWGDATGTGD